MGNSIQSTLNTMHYSTSQIQAEQSKQNMGNSKIDKNAFLRLLTEQLKNQDPLKPMDNSQMVAQQAQLAQVEAMENMSKALSNSASMTQASSLIDKYVSIKNPEFDSSSEISASNPQYIDAGVVTSAQFDSNGATIQINGNSYSLDQVGQVQNPALGSTTTE